jgi:phytoene dehydrogenase-like protein
VTQRHVDVVVVGAGHNGLVASVLLARAGLDVLVLEAQQVIGGAVRTERPFHRAPNLPTSTGAYLLGLMPPELIDLLGLELPLLRRDPHYFLPTIGERYLLFGSDRAELERQFVSFFSRRDWDANCALERELAALREDLAPTWLADPFSIEETAERYVRPELRARFVSLCRGSVGDYLDSFDFDSDLVKAMYAVTDGFSGLYGTWNTPGTGMNFMIHNMCRLPRSGGTWMIVEGGMGTVTRRLAEALVASGGRIETDKRVAHVTMDAGRQRVMLEDGTEVVATSVVFNTDPFTMRDVVGRGTLPAEYNARLDGYARPGSTLKVNLALSALPRFRCLPEDRGQFGPTIHLLPERDVIAQLITSFAEAARGQLPDFPMIEWYIHSGVDPTLTDEHRRLSSAFFVQWVPYAIAGSTWEAEETRYAERLLAIADQFAPGTSDLVVDMDVLSPPRIEQRFGIRHGHIHHVDNSFGFADRLPHRVPVPALYSCSAGTHPAGSVIGCAGYLAARACLEDLGVRPQLTGA